MPGLMTKICFSLIFLLLLGSCINRRDKSILNKNLYALPLNEATLNLKPLKEYSTQFNGYIYIMDSECSKCIGSFISFAKDLDKVGYKDSVLAIISVATQPIVSHYMKRYDFSKRIKIVLSENKGEWGISSVEKDNGVVYYLRDSQIEAVYQYFPQEDLY